MKNLYGYQSQIKKADFAFYCRNIFEDLSSRVMTDSQEPIISDIIFSNYLGWPLFLARRLIDIIKEEDQLTPRSLSNKQFYKIMKLIHFSNSECKKELIFKILDFHKNGKITTKNVESIFAQFGNLEKFKIIIENLLQNKNENFELPIEEFSQWEEIFKIIFKNNNLNFHSLLFSKIIISEIHNLSNIIKTFSQVENYFDFSGLVYKLNSQNFLEKYKIVIIKTDLYLFKYINEENDLKLEKLKSLNGFFPSETIESNLNGSVFYPVTFLNKSGNSIANVENIFFFLSRKTSVNFINYLNNLLEIKNFNDYYEINNEIGKGGFGRVYRGVEKFTNKQVAIKTIKKSNLKNYKNLELLKNELDVINFLKLNPNPNVITTLDNFEDSNYVYIIMELMDSNLKNFIKFKKDSLNEEIIKNIFLKISLGLKHLHSKGVIHRDLKLSNVLIKNLPNNNLEIKIADFGLSGIFLGNYQPSGCCGTLNYIAPEIFTQKYYDEKIDIWSLGVLLYSMNYKKKFILQEEEKEEEQKDSNNFKNINYKI